MLCAFQLSFRQAMKNVHFYFVCVCTRVYETAENRKRNSRTRARHISFTSQMQTAKSGSIVFVTFYGPRDS